MSNLPRAGHPQISDEYDLIVLGAGCAGLACAVEAADREGSVLVLEKRARPSGNILFAGGVICAAGTHLQAAQGIDEPVGELFRDLMRVSEQRADPDLARLYAEKSGDAIQWLSDAIGVQWAPIRERLAPVKFRAHQVKGHLLSHGAQLSRDLHTAAVKRKIPFLYKANTLKLLSDTQGGISGVQVLTTEGVREIRAKGGVVLATGGFHASPEMVREWIGQWACQMPLRGSNANTGENITLTRPLGARLVNMDQFHAGPVHGPTKANPSGAVNYGICVTREGKRYVDEGWTYVKVGKETARNTRDNHAFIVLDEEAERNPVVKDRFARYRRAKAPIFAGKDIGELAGKAGIRPEGLIATVNEFNEAVRCKKTGLLDPPNTLEFPCPVQTPRFYAVPFRGGITATFGGPLINTRAQVIGDNGQIIPGLYAAGNAAGGLFYGDYIIGSQLGAAIVFGRIAAADACLRLK